jgi:hypothetical protein
VRTPTVTQSTAVSFHRQLKEQLDKTERKEKTKILGFHSFVREKNDKGMAAMLVSLTMDANEKSFVHGTPTWRR